MRILPKTTLTTLALLSALLLPGLAAAPARAETETIFSASARLGPRGATIATSDGGGIQLSRHSVTIPASHTPGGVSNHFTVTTVADAMDWESFAEQLVAGTEAQYGTTEVMVYVHGYNTSYAGGLRRAAQIQADFDIPAGMVLFSWPAGSRVQGYSEDAKRALAAEPRLAQFLEALALSRASRITIVGHSLGAKLTMGTLADMRLAGSTPLFDKLGGVALLSPDIGAEEFVARVGAVGPLPSPVVAYVSKADVPLRVLAEVTGRDNLGAVTSAADLGGARAIVIDVTAGGTRDLAAHHAVIGQPRIIPAVNALRTPGFVSFGEMLAAGAMAEAGIDRQGESVYVVVQPRER